MAVSYSQHGTTVMTTQTVQLQTFDYGSSLTGATLRNIADDTLVATADSVNEVTVDSGLYAAVFDETAVIAAGTYRFRAVVGGQPINRYCTLSGVNNEVVQARVDKAAVLDPAARVKLDADQPDYAPATPEQVNEQVLDVLQTDTFAELAAPPAATSSLKDKITWLFMYARNKVTQTSSQRKVYRDDGTTVAGTSTTSDDGTTFTKGEDS